IRVVNEVMGNAVDVPRNADRINKAENQHHPERDAREKIKHAEEVDAVQNGCRDRDDVPAGVRKNPGICLRTLDRDQFTRRSWHCVRNPCWNTQFSRINPVGNSRPDLQTVQRHHIAERASRMAVRNSSSSNGLVKKADAPAFREVERTSGSSFPVNMMTRVDGESSRKRDWTSRPFMSGIQT